MDIFLHHAICQSIGLEPKKNAKKFKYPNGKKITPMTFKHLYKKYKIKIASYVWEL